MTGSTVITACLDSNSPGVRQAVQESMMVGTTQMPFSRSIAAPSLPIVLVATRDPPRKALGTDLNAAGVPIIVASEPEDVCSAVRSSHALRLILYGRDDVGAAATMASSELSRAGWAVMVVPTLLVDGVLSEPPRADGDVIRFLLALAEKGSLGRTDTPGPKIQDLPLRSRRIYVDPFTGTVVVDGVERPSLQGILARLLLYLARNHQRIVSRLEPGVRTEVFGALPTRKTWNNVLYRLRLMLGDSRDVLEVSPNHARIRTQRCDR